jgi:sulfur relay (sulfurtransferase) DsrC/TusE family protein
MNKIVRALEVYYFSKSIIEYYKKFPLDNMGMRHLALKLDSMFIIRLEQLESLLKLHYLHPSLVKYIKDMYCNFSTNGAKSSPIIKLCVKNIVLDDVNNNIKLNYDYLESLIKEFSKLTEMGGFFRVLCPNWRINLPPITAGKVYNADFLSFWHNSNICYLPDRSKENLANSNIIANESSEIYLGSFSQEFKGEYLMAISVYDSSKKIVNPGYFKPFSDFGDHIDAKNKISLLVYNSKTENIEGITERSQANCSFIHNTPYYDAQLPSATPILENTFQARIIGGISLMNLRQFSKIMINHHFNPN